MAKRGYRGKHPHDDMKVSKHSKSTDKRSAKLDVEYAKLHPKQKYSYIRDHQGFFPQASAVVICHADIATNEAITLVSTTGVSKTYTAKTSNSFGSNQFKANVDAATTATNLKSAIEHASGHNGELLVSRDSATLTITQKDPGPDGNTAIVETFDSEATVPSAFTGG
tara:strand:+ start:24 stop:524 length:501 start_codon:yes stop_codon:yes gene_type:complete